MNDKDREHLQWLEERIHFYEADMVRAEQQVKAAQERFLSSQKALESFRYALQVERARLNGGPLPILSSAPRVPSTNEGKKKTTGRELAEITEGGRKYHLRELHRILTEHRGAKVGVSTVREAAMRTPEFEKAGPNIFLRKANR